ncbi:MAG: hypothetical protein DYG89_26755 [Caldilinea sp. CFX5]|nr:hypothetical protein [Caldilinea sp. CFX5]
MRAAYLYHGSSIPAIKTFIPQRARGVGPAQDQLVALYATHVKELAIAFALPLHPNSAGQLAWRLAFPQDTGLSHPLIRLAAGTLNRAGYGYLYHLPAATFNQIDEWQWVSTVAVTPITIERINAVSYIDWVQQEG